MTSLFLFCAVVGGTVLVCQFVLTLIGLGSHADVPDDLPDDVPHDFHGDAHAADAHLDHTGHAHYSSWLFGVISFRTLVAASTFFGLAGLAANSAQQPTGAQLLIAVAAGAAAMYGVHWIMQAIGRLGEDGTIKVQRALGQEATVYVPIPAAKSQAGKVQVKLQNRLVEYEAITSAADRLATGTKVRVVGVAGNTLEVEPLHQPAASA